MSPAHSLVFTLTFAPTPNGFTVRVDPEHPLLQSTLEETVHGPFAARTDKTTLVFAPIDGSHRPWADGVIGPARVRNGILQLAQIGAEDLRLANNIVEGYLYDAVVCGLLGAMRTQGIQPGIRPTLEIDDGPVPQLRCADATWWRDVRHVVVGRADGARIRLRGLPRSEPFATWANTRILRACRRRFAAALGIPAAALSVRP